jgi:histidine triad (HIT) family protein
MQDNCIFCKIIAGEIPSATVYEDKNFRVIMDISPAAKGHMIMLSKRHCENLLDLDDESAASALLIARKLAKALKAELNCDGINLVQNNGKASGQTVFHFHIHLIPRYDNDQLSLGWAPGRYEDGEATSFAAALAARL